MKFKKVFVFMAIMVLSLSFAFSAINYERDETFITGGGLWNTPSNWNPFTPWAETTGTTGLVYETLFTFDPLSSEVNPWLAESGEWISDNEYIIHLRKGIKWTDGNTFDANDVYFTFDVARKENISYSYIWEYLKDVEIIDKYSVKVTFKQTNYSEWMFFLYTRPIVPHHIWENMSGNEIMKATNKNPVGTGMYMYETFGEDRMVWKRNDNWWGKEVFGKLPEPKRIVYLRIFGNNVALGMLMKGELDLSNFFIPGVPKIKDVYNLKTYYKDAPYMLPENTALLFLNTTKKPLGDANFRRAISFAIDSKSIATRVFENQVETSNSAGLLPIDAWMKFYNEEAVKKLGFSYNPEKAKEMLKEAGYKDINDDGFVENLDGEKIELEIIVPKGWTDWEESIKIISNNLRNIGVNAIASFPDYSIYINKIQYDDFDMAINNFNSNVSATPWTYWQWVANDRIDAEQVTDGNWGRYDNVALFELIDEFNRTDLESERAQELADEIQEILLEDMPSIPLWYNGMWFQGTENYWTNFPDENNKISYPVTWGGKWQLGGLNMLLNLEKK